MCLTWHSYFSFPCPWFPVNFLYKVKRKTIDVSFRAPLSGKPGVLLGADSRTFGAGWPGRISFVPLLIPTHLHSVCGLPPAG